MSDDERPGSIIERWVGTVTIAALALACLLILRPFISAVLWASILCFTTWPLFIRLKANVGGRSTMAASLAVLAVGTPKAMTAAAHKRAPVIYHLLTIRQSYEERVFARCQAPYQQRLENRIRHEARDLGFDLVRPPT